MYKMTYIIACLIMSICFGTVYAEDNASVSSPLFYWSMDEQSGNAMDQGSVGAALSVPNSVVRSKGISGNSLVFNKNGYASADKVAKALDGAEGVAISGAFKNYDFPDSTQKQYMLVKLFMDNTLGGINIYIEGQEIIFEARSGKTDAIKRVKAPLTTKYKWHGFVAAADYKNKQMKLYIDGQLAVSSKAEFASSEMEIGAPQSPDFTIGGAGTLKFNGEMDEISIFDYVPSEKQIEEISKNISPSGEKTNPYVMFQNGFEETGLLLGDEMIDISEYAEANGKFGSCISFAGKEKALDLGRTWQLNANDAEYMSVSLWFKQASELKSGTSLFNMWNASRKALDISICDNKLIIMAKSGISDNENIIEYPLDTDEEWHYLGLEVGFGEKTIRLWLDGTELVNDKKIYFNNDKNKISFTNYSAYLGGELSGPVFDGYIDEIAVLTKPIVSEIEMLSQNSVEDVEFLDYIYKEADFSDIADSQFKDSISDAVSRGIMEGISKTEFAPKMNVKRIDYIGMVNKLMGFKTVTYRNSIRDIEEGDKNGSVYQTALDNGILAAKMLKNNKFRPDNPITVADACLVLCLAADKSQSITAEEAVSVMKELNVADMVNDNPDVYITREETAYMLSQFIKIIQQRG